MSNFTISVILFILIARRILDPTSNTPQQSDKPQDGKSETISLASLANASSNNEEATPKVNKTWLSVLARSKLFGIVAAVIVAIILVTGTTYLYLKQNKKAGVVTINGTSLTTSQLQQLAGNSLKIAQGTQTLDFNSAVSVNNGFQVTGNSTLNNLAVTGTFATNNTEIKQNSQVDGSTLLQGAVTTKGQLNVGGNLIVTGTSIFTGNANFNGNGAFSGTLSAGNLNVKTATIGGLTFGHIITSGTTPTVSVSNADGGGTATISGNDTSGVVTITTGSGALGTGGDLVTITFRSPFSSTPHAVASPVGLETATAIANPTGNPASGAGEFYVSASTTQLVIGVSKLNSGVAGVTYTFNYLVTQ
ncbi:MAG: hypothetical protein ACHQUB_03535 [Candidatus Saccharimonadia bacterium]